MKTYGYFDDANREYVITDPHTPVKWINYVGSLNFGGFIDHTGGALICAQDPALNRITRYVAQLPSSEFKGTTLYLRTREGERYRVFSPYFVPTLDRYDRYECHVGLGYTRIVSEFYSIRTDSTFFVPPGGQQLIQDIKITNLGESPLELDAIPLVEYTHPDALKQFTNADWVPQTMQSRAHREPDGKLVLVQYPFMLRDTRVNYLTSNLTVRCFESDRAHFLGDHEYGTWAAPLSLQKDELSCYEALRGDNIGVLLHHLGRLKPGQTVRVITQLGQAASLRAALPAIRRYREHAEVDRAFAELKAFWDHYLDAFQAETPDAAMNTMVNIHNAHQCYITLTWSRYLSLYQLGYGARGIGFRDSSEDVMGALAGAPGEAREMLRKLLSVQKRSGAAMHLFNPLTMVAEVGDAAERPEAPQYYSDDHLWSILAVTAYLKETGDFAFLDEMIPYLEKGRDAQPVENGTVLDHLRRAIAFTHTDLGAHGLPLLGFADWNDTINLRKGAESLFTANLYGRALQEMIALAEQRGDRGLARQYRTQYSEIRLRVNECAWDGEWYVSYFDADGQPLGSHKNQAGQIHVNGQSWPILSGFAPNDRAEAALSAVRARLNTSKGIKLSAPGYNAFDPLKGGITTYPPGAKENGGIFLHTNPWVIIAETLAGHGDRAFEYYSQINPANKNDTIDEYECEPYVYAQNILGDEHPQFGLARNSWLSGTASWIYQAATQYILGIRPTYRGLQIDPCIPHAWPGFRVVRRFRGAVYRIVISNPDGVCKGIKRCVVDGEECADNVLPIFEVGSVHAVEVIMGQRSTDI
jgi:cellobiose phosphorylase